MARIQVPSKRLSDHPTSSQPALRPGKVRRCTSKITACRDGLRAGFSTAVQQIIKSRMNQSSFRIADAADPDRVEPKPSALPQALRLVAWSGRLSYPAARQSNFLETGHCRVRHQNDRASIYQYRGFAGSRDECQPGILIAILVSRVRVSAQRNLARFTVLRPAYRPVTQKKF